jgi:hypothetical protein
VYKLLRRRLFFRSVLYTIWFGSPSVPEPPSSADVVLSHHARHRQAPG